MRFEVKPFRFGEREGQNFVEFSDDLGRKLGAIWATDDGEGLEVVTQFHEHNVDVSNAKKILKLDLTSPKAREILSKNEELDKK